MKTLDVLTFILLVIGGINWGLVGLFDINLITVIFGTMTVITRVIYCLVGLSALYEIVAMRFISRRWHMGRFVTT